MWFAWMIKVGELAIGDSTLYVFMYKIDEWSAVL